MIHHPMLKVEWRCFLGGFVLKSDVFKALLRHLTQDQRNEPALRCGKSRLIDRFLDRVFSKMAKTMFICRLIPHELQLTEYLTEADTIQSQKGAPVEAPFLSSPTATCVGLSCITLCQRTSNSASWRFNVRRAA